MARILLVRHGETTNAGVFSGALNPELSEIGVEQAIKLGKRLQKEPIDIAYSSDKNRAINTAKLILGHDCEVNFHPNVILNESSNLREIDHGRWEGKTKDDVMRLWPYEYDQWTKDPYLFAPEGGEPAIQVIYRCIPFIRKLINEHHGKNILLVSHRAVIRLIIAHYLGLPYRLYRDLFELDNASLSILSFKNESQAKLLLFNDTSHCK